MPKYCMLLAPSANRVYAGQAFDLARAELAATCPTAADIKSTKLAEIPYLGFTAEKSQLPTIARQSACLALFEQVGDLLRPVALPEVFTLGDDLVTIPKYQGKTNEQFTQLLLGVTLAAIGREPNGPRQILDPLAGRGTTLSTALRLGHDAYGIELDDKAFDQMASFFKTYFRRKHLKHHAAITPVRRQGRAVARRFDLEFDGHHMTAFTGDTRQSAALFGKKRFDAVVTDAPYGVAHGATSDGTRDRSPATLLREAIPIWAEQLKHGGALGIAWNTLGLSRDDLVVICTRAGLIAEPWEFTHRVDSSIKRDVLVAHKP